jgi:hypothetical protein
MYMVKLNEAPQNSAKKFMAHVTDTVTGRQRTVYFGARGYQDYTIHKDKERRDRYLARHASREDWSNPFTAGFWAAHLLWNKPTLQASINDIKKRFKIGFY